MHWLGHLWNQIWSIQKFIHLLFDIHYFIKLSISQGSVQKTRNVFNIGNVQLQRKYLSKFCLKLAIQVAILTFGSKMRKYSDKYQQIPQNKVGHRGKYRCKYNIFQVICFVFHVFHKIFYKPCVPIHVSKYISIFCYNSC